MIALFFLLLLITSMFYPDLAAAATFSSSDYTVETGITPIPSPSLFPTTLQTGFSQATNAKPMRLSLSSDIIDYGPINPTNPIKRLLNISLDSGSVARFSLFSLENHPLRQEEQSIPDTTCDDGSCSEKQTAPWINPFTFGLGFSFDDRDYRQFADVSKGESIQVIDPGNITVKLNINQNQPLPIDKPYENTLIFIALPKL